MTIPSEKRCRPVSWEAFLSELADPPPPTRAQQDFLAYTPRVQTCLPTADRWLLSSNLHKSVRFGLVDAAAATAEALRRADPVYFYRRLPIIAFEDVGLGNLGLCLDVLAWCRNLQQRSKYEGMGLAAYLGARLAAAPKCRSACDLLCLVENQHGKMALDQETAALGRKQAEGIAASGHFPLRVRAAALLRLDRLPIRDGDQRAASLRGVCRRLDVPEVVTQALVQGTFTDQMATFVPLIFELLGKAPLRIEESAPGDLATPLDTSLLCAAADKHTRIGQRAIKEWIRATHDLSEFYASRGMAGAAERVTRIALFHIESSFLNRRLTNDCLDLLRAEYERSDMLALGLDTDGAVKLYAIMESNLVRLNEIRKALRRQAACN